MHHQKAKNIFLGRDGEIRGNCAEAVLRAFKDTMGVEENLLALAKGHGGGRAPEGYCGAYYVAKLLIEKYCCLEKTQEFEQYFKELASSLKCNEIRQARKLSCVGCVEKAAEFIATARTNKMRAQLPNLS
ncbi:hypothetical protein A2291_01400 [candidate division WOR-1 bacterium RIFOXYB2_FULL_42_35]|uniref:C_GCAxxG_C_C family protein n=1 Tax=candidate division WOR-1 bacterium RIFOXYC2_FULL_41_25 TaxID=1802586 RepID=A0A1F4TLV2_UNCSA|nr:MAG: hypothetical protein A2247_07875 [candidate division WOR-1 bacterium RIFOXYA2_FULL_41_14]OGC22772.1 MAG: hypothetical protein A2291_01400 [candidate division WOR-1 bacterium RIFOXYB2_FULL_42_35]OGC33695.1 MAG: hypothetical protein A2462_03725 [candidate division WOR-1 bacterium RIFOXYC2_FULL_41_25]